MSSQSTSSNGSSSRTGATSNTSASESNIYRSRITVLKHYLPPLVLMDQHMPNVFTYMRVAIEFLQWVALVLIPTVGVATVVLSSVAASQNETIYDVAYSKKEYSAKSPDLGSPINVPGVGLKLNRTTTVTTGKHYFGQAGARHVFEWGKVISAISIPVHFTILPLWETSNNLYYIGKTASSGVAWASIGIVFIAVSLLLVQLTINREVLNKSLTRVASLAFHLVTTIGFLPLLHSILPFLVCTVGSGGVGSALQSPNKNAQLAEFRDSVSLDTSVLHMSYQARAYGVVGTASIGTISQVDDITSSSMSSATITACFGDAHLISLFVLGLTAAVLLVGLKAISVFLLVDDVPSSGTPLGRSHSLIEGARLWASIAFAVLYHYLFAEGQRMTFAILMAVASFGLGVGYAVVLPFYRLRTNQIFASFFMCVALIATLAAVTITGVWQENIGSPSTKETPPAGTAAATFLSGNPSFVTMPLKENIDAVILFVCLPLLTGLIMWVSQIRVSSSCQKALSLAGDGVASMPYDLVEAGLGIFPGFLPVDEIHPYRCIEAMLLNEDRFRRMRNEQLMKTQHLQQEARQQRDNEHRAPLGRGQRNPNNTSTLGTEEHTSTYSTGGGTSGVTGTLNREARREVENIKAINHKRQRKLAAKQLKLLLQKRRNRRANAADIAAEQVTADELAIGFPYLNSVLFPTDVEVATRFLHEFERATGLWPSLLMITFAIRIYTKGLAKYVRCSWLEVQLVTCLCSYVPTMKHVALGIAERVTGGEDVSLSVMWAAQRRVTQINAALAIHDNSTRRHFALAQQFHREALQNMKYFWRRLSHEQVDVVQLSVLAKVITDRRQEALEYYMRVLEQSSDHHSIIRYAQFLDNVMLDPESAMTCRENILDALQQEQTSAEILRNEFAEREAVLGELANNNIRQKENEATTIDTNSSRIGLGSDFGSSDTEGKNTDSSKKSKAKRRDARRERAIGKHKDDKGSTRRYTTVQLAERSNTIQNLNRNLDLVFLVIALVIVGLFVLLLLTAHTRQRSIDKVETVASARTLSQETAALAQQLGSNMGDYYDLLISQAALDDSTSTTTSVQTATAAAVALAQTRAARTFDSLKLNVASFRNAVADIVFGKYESSYKDVVALFASPIAETRHGSAHVLVGLVSASNALINGAELYIAAVKARIADIQLAAASGTDVDFSTRSAEDDLVKGIVNNAWTTAASVFNESIDVFTQEADANTKTSTIAFVVMYVFVLVLLVALYFVLVFNFRKISSTKLSTLGLFTLIPKTALEALHDESEKRVVNFDEPDEEFTKMKIARGLADDTEAMQRLIQQTEQDLPLLDEAEAGDNQQTNVSLTLQQKQVPTPTPPRANTNLHDDSLYRAVLQSAQGVSIKTKKAAATNEAGAGDGMWGELFLYGNLGNQFDDTDPHSNVLTIEENAAADEEYWKEEFTREMEEKNAWRHQQTARRRWCFTVLSADGCSNLLVALGAVGLVIATAAVVAFSLDSTSDIRNHVEVGDSMMAELGNAIEDRYQIRRLTEAFVINASDASLKALTDAYSARKYAQAAANLQHLAGVTASSLAKNDYFAKSSIDVSQRVFNNEDAFQPASVMLAAAGIITCAAAKTFQGTFVRDNNTPMVFFPIAYPSVVSSSTILCSSFPSTTWTAGDFLPTPAAPLAGDDKSDYHYIQRTNEDFDYWVPFNPAEGSEQKYRSPDAAKRYEARYLPRTVDPDSYGAVLKQKLDHLDVRFNIVKDDQPQGEAADLALLNATIMLRRAWGALRNPYLADSFATSVTILFGALTSVFSSTFLVMDEHTYESRVGAYSKVAVGAILLIFGIVFAVVLSLGEQVIDSGFMGATAASAKATLRNYKRTLKSRRSTRRKYVGGLGSVTTASSLTASTSLADARGTWGALRYSMVFAVGVALCGAGLLAVGIILITLVEKMNEDVTNVYNLKFVWSALIDIREHASLLARHGAIYGESSAPIQFVRMVTDLEDYLDRFASFMTTDSAAVDTLSQCTTALQTQTYIQSIALTIGASLFSLQLPRSLQKLEWNISADAFQVRNLVNYPEQEFYSNKASDLALGQLAKERLVINLLYGPLMKYSGWGDGFQWCVTAKDNAANRYKSHFSKNLDDMKNMRLIAIALMAAACFLSLLSAVLVTKKRFATFSARFKSVARNDRNVKSEGTERGDQLYTRLSQEALGGIAFLLTLFSALLVYVVVDLSTVSTDTNYEQVAATRSFNVFRSLIASQQLVGAGRTTLREEAVKAGEFTITSADEFYKGRAGKMKALDENLFGTIQSSLQQFYCTSSGASSGVDYTTVGEWTTTVTPLLNEVGIDPATRRWRDEVTALTYLTGDSAAQMLAGLQTAAPPLISALRTSTSQHADYIKNRADVTQVVYIVLLVVITIVLALLYLFVFKPMISSLVVEEEGTNLMLKMIPVAVRDSVPAIAEYLESGVVMQDLMIHELNEAATDLSTIPTVTIDFKGRIVQFSKAAEEAFLTSKAEVIGKNVKVLMPENVAKDHDRFLLNYRRTGIKHIIGKTRHVQALKRDGNVFPAELSVREIGNGRNTYFIGTIRNVAADIQFERAMALSTAVSAAANVPVIVINGQGIILKFNRAADDLFRFDETVVGKNVNILMPPDVAREHNRYLANYLSFRVKNIIDAPRIVQAKRKRGTFPIRLSVKELDRGPSRDPIFIGYLEDLSKQLNLELSSMVSDAIIQTSSIPLVAIDHDGIVINWSPAAELTFGLSQEEILGQNIRIIMPDDIAVKHDSFIKAYQQTGIRKVIGRPTTQRAKRRTTIGEWEYISVRVSLKDIPGTTPYTNKFVAYLEDVTSSVELEREYRISASTTRLSSIPLITINSVGIVYSFSAAAEETFGYREQEVVGNNVKMLMPDNIAAKHDGYLRSYNQAGERRYVDSSRLVTARHKNGTIFPAELTTHTVEVNQQFLIVGFLRNVADDVELMQSNAYNTAISALASTPLIWIDTKGIIMGCSETTIERFQWSREELMGQNINILMPDHFAQVHDKYLEAYARRMKTDGPVEAARKSKILGKERYVMAKTRDERTFPACVLVKDIHVEGSMPIFVGYIRDLTNEIQLAVQQSMATTIIQSSFVPIVCIDRMGIISEFSAAAERDLGYTREEAVGKNVKMLMPQDVARQHDGFLKAYAKTGIKNILDNPRSVVAVKKDGNQFYAELMVKEIIRSDALGKEVVEYIGFIRDLSQHYVLSQANHINEVVAQLSTVPIIIITSKGIILEANHAAELDFGYAISEMVGSNIKMLMPQHIASKHDGYLSRYLTTGEKHVIDRIRLTTGQRKNGQLFPVELSVKEVQKDGASPQYIGYARDATLQQEINMAHQINSTIIELSATPLLVIDHLGTVEVFSRAAEETFGYEKNEVLGRNVKMLMPQSVADQHDGFLSKYLETGVQSVIGTNRRVQARRKNGTLFPGELSVRQVIKEEAKHPIYIGYLRDLTEDIRMEALNAFSSTAHELSPVPMIVIDHLGFITRFSASAEQEFRVPAADIIGKNISTLQPHDVASQHDEYLRRYLTTGQKHIIGSSRIVSARRLDGTEFRAQLTVQEVRRRKPELSNDESAWALEHNFIEGDDKPNFVGYLRNIEQDIKVEELSREGIAMMDLAPLPVVVCSQLGIILRVNAAVETVFGYNSATITGTNVKVLMPESIAKEHDDYLKKYNDTGIRNVINRTRLTTGRKVDGTTFPMEISVRELVVQGIEKQYVAYLRDMTPMQRAKEAAMLNEAVVALAATPLIAITPRGAIIRFTEQAEKLFGYAAGEVLGKNVKMLMPEDVAAKHDGYLSTYLRKRVKTIIDSRRVITAVHKNGTHFPCEFGVREILEEGTVDKTQAFVGYIRDLKEGEFAVEGSSEINALMMDLSLHGVIIMTTDGIVERANDAVTSMFGFADKKDFIGRNIKFIMPNEIAEKHDGYLRNYLESGIKHVIDTRRVTTARNVVTNETFPVEISVKELREPDKPTRYVGYVRLVAHELQVAQARRLNSAALDLSPSGMIVIDSGGTIMMFSRVAEELFECLAADIVGLNVNVLMPPSVAARHDDHLSAYRITREKHVIDTQQTLLGKKFNRNEMFAISLLVRELQFTSVPGMESCFVGYVSHSGSTGVPPTGGLHSTSLSNNPLDATTTSGVFPNFLSAPSVVNSAAAASFRATNYNDPMSTMRLDDRPRDKTVKRSKKDKGDKKEKRDKKGKHPKE